MKDARASAASLNIIAEIVMAKTPKWSVDPESYELAKHFLPNGEERALRELSQVIQDAVEDWFRTSAWNAQGAQNG